MPQPPSRRRLDSVVHQWKHRGGSLSSIAWLAYLALVIDASLYPFVGWRDRGIGAFDYLVAPWPRHLLEFDLLVNVFGYLPLGLLAVYALYPRFRGFVVVVLVTLAAALLSGSLEALQTFLPTRVASKVDLITNTAGALAGAWLASLTVEAVLDRGRLREWRLQWFTPEASGGLVLIALWMGAVLYPDALALASGSLARLFEGGLGNLLAQLTLWEPTPLEFELTEVLGCAAFLCGSGLIFLNLLKPAAPRAPLILSFVLASLVAKTFGTGQTYGSADPLVWLTRGAALGILLGAVLLLAALRLGATARARLAVVALCVGVALANLMPENPYFGAAWQDWERGKLLNFYGLALGVNLSWPYLALLYLMLKRSRRETQRATV
jgi:VanZ family protein